MMTKQELISTVQKAEPLYTNNYVPGLEFFYFDFAEKMGISTDTYTHINKFIKDASYNEKKKMFTDLGFNVLYMTLSSMKTLDFLSDTSNGPSIEQQFLDKQRNVFMIEVTMYHSDSIVFVLEYRDDKPLADFTVNYDEVRRKKEQQEKIRNLFFKK